MAEIERLSEEDLTGGVASAVMAGRLAQTGVDDSR